MKNKWSQDLKFLNCHQKKSFIAHTYFDKKKVIFCCSIQHISDKEWTLFIKKERTFNANNKYSNDHIHQTKNKWRILPIVRQQTLKDEAYIYARSFEDKYPTLAQKLFFVKTIVYSCKVRKSSQNTLKILRGKIKCCL